MKTFKRRSVTMETGKGGVERTSGSQQSSLVKGSSSTFSPEEIQAIRVNLCHFDPKRCLIRGPWAGSQALPLSSDACRL